MALRATIKEVSFGVGDQVKVYLKVKDGEKTRNQIFDGMVIGIKGRDDGKSFTVRKIGAQRIGVEMIFPLNTPSLEKIEVIRKGTEGVQHAKLYYTRDKSPREIEKIYSRATRKNVVPKAAKKKVAVKKNEKKVAAVKKVTKKVTKK